MYTENRNAVTRFAHENTARRGATPRYRDYQQAAEEVRLFDISNKRAVFFATFFTLGVVTGLLCRLITG